VTALVAFSRPVLMPDCDPSAQPAQTCSPRDRRLRSLQDWRRPTFGGEPYAVAGRLWSRRPCRTYGLGSSPGGRDDRRLGLRSGRRPRPARLIHVWCCSSSGVNGGVSRPTGALPRWARRHARRGHSSGTPGSPSPALLLCDLFSAPLTLDGVLRPANKGVGRGR